MKPEEVRDVIENPTGDMLDHMFKIQESFANLCFSSNDIRDREGETLTCKKVGEDAENLRLRYSHLMVPWIWEMHRAMEDELREVGELLPWKHWSQSEVGEKVHPEFSSGERLNHLRLELIDIIHFLMEALIFTGLSAEEVYHLYLAKNRVNIERQETDYNDANKTEEDNQSVAESFGSEKTS